ncbi:MAG: hypothetical protein KKA65_01085 [Nanoarchaeota archaeon]|nr:hypothetical protein [Nanoarchaeota archaeon]MBU4352215.1 hypothetical protein [Nanoarchaeota archaeon]MBU4456073.1 hypothetical protein [Nanoarchaeota archaeon]MCG2720306.1 hypothetical protein [Nanoarchaeota archaeon]
MESNKVLTILLVAALFVSVFGTLSAINRLEGFQSLTGLWGVANGTAPTYAATNLTISSLLNVNFTDDTADFGSGYISAGFDACTIATDGTETSGCVGFTIPNGLLLENQGNRHAKLNISNTNYSNSLLGGTASGYAWMWDDPEGDATCIGGNFTGNESAWSNLTGVINEANYQSNNVLCGLFNFSDASDLINISIKFHIDQTAYAREVSDTWIIYAIDVSPS